MSSLSAHLRLQGIPSTSYSSVDTAPLRRAYVAPSRRAAHGSVVRSLCRRQLQTLVVGKLPASCSQCSGLGSGLSVHAQNGASPLDSVAKSRAALDPRDAQVEQLEASVQELKDLVAQQQLALSSLQRAHRLSAVAAPGPVSPLDAQAGAAPPAAPPALRPFEAQLAIADRRSVMSYDARFHSTNRGATPQDYRVLPNRIILVRHAQSEGNVDSEAYTFVPDPAIPLTPHGRAQARDAGLKIRTLMEADRRPYSLFFYTSPYRRSKETYEDVAQAFEPHHLQGVQEEVQLREQDFGNFQNAADKQREMAERIRFGRFFYRFPNGESGADVYDRMTIFEDHMIRDINAGRYTNNTSLVLVTHGLALRIFLMRWFHWTVDQFLGVYNPPNAEPLVLERVTAEHESRQNGPISWIHTKALYRLTEESRRQLVGCTPEMCQSAALPPDITLHSSPPSSSSWASSDAQRSWELGGSAAQGAPSRQYSNVVTGLPSRPLRKAAKERSTAQPQAA